VPRVLCGACLGHNDGNYRFCQSCCVPAKLTRPAPRPQGEAQLHINDSLLNDRPAVFAAARAAKVGHRRKSVVADDVDRFIRQRSGGAVGWENATPEQVVDYLAYKDSQGTGTKVVHVLHCPQIGTDSLVQCKELGLGCAQRYAHTSLNKQYISKLRCAYTEILANSDDWSVTEHRGNPVKSVPVTKYLAFSAAEQQKAGVATKQARPLLRPDLAAIVAAIRIQLAGTENPAESIALVRDITWRCSRWLYVRRVEEEI
ncbi:unnamed protein product, partial [Sphacelaria rigidula]